MKQVLSEQERRDMGLRLRLLLVERFGSLAEAARKTGLEVSSITSWTAGRMSPSAHALMQLGKADLSLDELFGLKSREQEQEA